MENLLTTLGWGTVFKSVEMFAFYLRYNSSKMQQLEKDKNVLSFASVSVICNYFIRPLGHSDNCRCW